MKSSKNKIDLADPFHQEIDSSARLRTNILIKLLALEGFLFLLVYLFYQAEYLRLFNSSLAIHAVLIFLVIIVIYELILHFYRLGRRGPLKHSRVVPRYANAFFEVTLLSLLLAFIVEDSGQVTILHSPVALTYLIFIILSTLKLDFKLSLFTGVLSAAQYILLSFVFDSYSTQTDTLERFFFEGYSIQTDTSEQFQTKVQIFGLGIMLIITAVSSGFVARLIRKTMIISLNSVREKNDVIDLFGQQISPQIAQEILNDRTGLSGRRKNVTVMFLDIRNFTSFSEHRSPGEVVAYLNKLFGFMIEIVQENQGIINQFLGDGFMATFGAPVTDPDSSFNAVKASLEILKRKDFEISKGNVSATRIGIGLHHGEAVTGNIGSEMRKQYSITGSVVIIASRIEGLTKNFDTELLVSEEVISRLPEDMRTEFNALGEVSVKGSEKMISIYNYISINQLKKQ